MKLGFQQLRNILLLMVITASFFRTSKAGLYRNLLEGVSFVNFEKDESSYLNITSIASQLIEDAVECGFACLKFNPCFSYNLAAAPDVNRKLLCELLPSDKYNNSDKFNASKMFHHFSIPSPCGSWPCQNNGTCISNYAKKSYVCHCVKGFTGKHCQRSSFTIISAIISGNMSYESHLHQFLKTAVGSHSRWLLCYRASTHGWAASTFHSRCDGKNHTVTIIKNGQYVFGGYTDIPWESSGGYGSTPNAFIFSLRNKEGLAPFKSTVNVSSKAIYKTSIYGPRFGGGSANIHISDYANSNSHSYANFGYANHYSVPSAVKDRQTVLAGSYNFTPDEVEVFYLG